MSNEHDFTYPETLSSADRAALLQEASETVNTVNKPRLGTLGGETVDALADARARASQLLQDLGSEIAKFSAFPEVLPLRAENFTEHGMSVPLRFADLAQSNNFYWIQFPLTLAPRANMPFNKLELSVEFINPADGDGHLTPRAHMILPDKKFKTLMALNDSLDIQIGEDFEFQAATPEIKGDIGVASGSGKADVSAKAAGKLGLMVGPFSYTMKKAQIERSDAGTEKVFWRITGAEFFQENTPTFIVVVQVPKEAKQVQVAAALKAYHEANIGAMGIGEFIGFLQERVANFFKQGAPLGDTHAYDLSGVL